MNKFKYISLIASSVLLFTACGGGSGSSEEGNKPSLKEINGKVVDGPISGAKVCLDLNSNNSCDIDEPNAKTKEDGSYSFETDVLEADIKKYNIIASGGKDTVSGEELKGILKTKLSSFNDSANVTPATTFVAELVENGTTLEEAKKEVKGYLGIGNDKDVASIDKDMEKKLTALHKAMTSDENVNGYEKLSQEDKEERAKQIEKKIEKAEKEVAKIFESNVYPAKSGLKVYFDKNNNAKLDAGETQTTADKNGVFDFATFKDVQKAQGEHTYYMFRTDNGLALTAREKEQFSKGIFISPITTFIATTAGRLASANDVTNLNMRNFMAKISKALGLTTEELYLNPNSNPKVKEISDKIVKALEEKKRTYFDLVKMLENDVSNVDDLLNNLTENLVSDIKLTEIEKTIEISAASGNRIQNDTRHILSSGEDYPNAPKFMKKEDSGKIKELKIISGNDDEIFEVYQEQGNGHWQVRVKKDKISTLETNKEYTLKLQVIDGFDKKTNTIEVKMKIVTPAIKAKDVEVSIADAKTGYSGGYKLKGTNEPILYTLYKNGSPYYKDRLDVIESANAKEEEIKYELEENETFKLLRFNIEYGNYYAIVLKDGKTPKAKEELKLKAIVSYVEGGVTKTQESAFTVTITNAENKSYADIQTLTKTDGTNGKELEILTEEPDVITEKFPAVLKDYTYDGEYKIYPSSPSAYFERDKMLEKEATTEGDITYNIISGNEEGYFKEFKKNWTGKFEIVFDSTKTIPSGDYSLNVNISQGGKTSNDAVLKFTIDEIQAPSVIEETVKLNLADKNTKNDSYYAQEAATTKVTPLFIFDFSKNKYNPEKFGILKKDDKENNLLNGSKNLKYKLISDSSNSYEVKEFYKKSYGSVEKLYGIFLKEGKTGNITANLEIQIVGEFNGTEYPNPTYANVDIEFKINEFTLKPEALTVKKTAMKEDWKDKHKYFSLVTKEPSSWQAEYSVFPFSNIGSYQNTASLKFEIDGASNTYIIKKVGEYWELQLKDGVSEAKAETLTIKVTGILDPSHSGTFELQITE